MSRSSNSTINDKYKGDANSILSGLSNDKVRESRRLGRWWDVFTAQQTTDIDVVKEGIAGSVEIFAPGLKNVNPIALMVHAAFIGIKASFAYDNKMKLPIGTTINKFTRSLTYGVPVGSYKAVETIYNDGLENVSPDLKEIVLSGWDELSKETAYNVSSDFYDALNSISDYDITQDMARDPETGELVDHTGIRTSIETWGEEFIQALLEKYPVLNYVVFNKNPYAAQIEAERKRKEEVRKRQEATRKFVESAVQKSFERSTKDQINGGDYTLENKLRDDVMGGARRERVFSGDGPKFTADDIRNGMAAELERGAFSSGSGSFQTKTDDKIAEFEAALDRFNGPSPYSGVMDRDSIEQRIQDSMRVGAEFEAASPLTRGTGIGKKDTLGETLPGRQGYSPMTEAQQFEHAARRTRPRGSVPEYEMGGATTGDRLRERRPIRIENRYDPSEGIGYHGKGRVTRAYDNGFKEYDDGWSGFGDRNDWYSKGEYMSYEEYKQMTPGPHYYGDYLHPNGPMGGKGKPKRYNKPKITIDDVIDAVKDLFGMNDDNDRGNGGGRRDIGGGFSAGGDGPGMHDGNQ